MAVTAANVNENGLVYSQARLTPKNQRDAPHTAAARTIVAAIEIRVNMVPKPKPIPVGISALLRDVHSRNLPRYPLIVVFFTGGNEPPDCLPMRRAPSPERGFLFDIDFGDRLLSALAVNEAVHDGAVAFGRLTTGEPYRCAGWSFLICPRSAATSADPNRGAAYNSAISLSLSAGVDCVALYSIDELECFVDGEHAST